LFLRVLYVRSLQVVHASAITGRFSALATVPLVPRRHPATPTSNKAGDLRGSLEILCGASPGVNDGGIAMTGGIDAPSSN
jgi:hypothetical protein